MALLLQFFTTTVLTITIPGKIRNLASKSRMLKRQLKRNEKRGKKKKRKIKKGLTQVNNVIQTIKLNFIFILSRPITECRKFPFTLHFHLLFLLFLD